MGLSLSSRHSVKMMLGSEGAALGELYSEELELLRSPYTNLRISVPRSIVGHDKIVYYQVCCTAVNTRHNCERSWTVMRRFKSFFEMHHSIEEALLNKALLASAEAERRAANGRRRYLKARSHSRAKSVLKLFLGMKRRHLPGERRDGELAKLSAMGERWRDGKLGVADGVSDEPRASDELQLSRELSSASKAAHAIDLLRHVPSLPRRTLGVLSRATSQRFRNFRRRALERYLNEILKVCDRGGIGHCGAFVHVFEMLQTFDQKDASIIDSKTKRVSRYINMTTFDSMGRDSF